MNTAGSNNPIGHNRNFDKIPFHPYFADWQSNALYFSVTHA